MCSNAVVNANAVGLAGKTVRVSWKSTSTARTWETWAMDIATSSSNPS